MDPTVSSVVVTGVGAGIGRAILERLSDDGWTVIGIEIDPTKASAARSWLTDRARPGNVVTGDAADPDVLEQARDLAVEQAPLQGWVSNAAVISKDSVHVPQPEAVDRLLRLNVQGTYWGASLAVRTFLAQRSGGSIVSIASIHGRAASPNWASYEMSKAAIMGLTRNLAVEYGPAGIRSNTVDPGAIWSEANERLIEQSPDPEGALRLLADQAPLGRIGQPREISSVVAFLLSDEASFITGASIPVDGGSAARSYAMPADPAILAAHPDAAQET